MYSLSSTSQILAPRVFLMKRRKGIIPATLSLDTARENCLASSISLALFSVLMVLLISSIMAFLESRMGNYNPVWWPGQYLGRG